MFVAPTGGAFDSDAIAVPFLGQTGVVPSALPRHRGVADEASLAEDLADDPHGFS